MPVAIRAITRLIDADDVNVTPGAGVDEYALTWDHDTTKFVLRAPTDLSGYALLAGRAGGQTLYGGTAANETLTLEPTSHATKTTASVLLAPSGGNVGVGVSIANTKLDVAGIVSSGATGGSGEFRSYQDSFAGNNYVSLRTDTSAQKSGLYRNGTPAFFAFYDTSSGNVALSANFSGASIAFQIGGVEKARVSNDGRLGIGTASPATALHVVGAATITAGIRPAADSTTALQLQTAAGASVLNVDTTNGRVGIGTSAPEALLELQTAIAPTFDGGFNNLRLKYSGGAAAGSVGAGIVFNQHTDSNYPTVFVRVGGMYGVKEAADGAYGGGLVFYTQPNSGAAMAERMRIGMSGNVGIGTTAPAEALDVTGNINTTGVIKVDDVQVLSNRVIDARCADAANSGDATTDGLIDALRDAMVAHGLIAAA